MMRCTVALLCAVGLVGCASKQKQSYKLAGRAITVRTEPAGATVTQFAAPTGDRVQLGMTPLVNQPVMVLTGVKGTFHGAGHIGSLVSQMNVARVRIEKEGFKPYEGNLSTDPKRVTEHVITLEPAPPTTRPTASAAP